MARTYTEVSKRARNSINTQVKKLVVKYGFKDTRLVINKLFEHKIKQEKLKEEIAQREKELLQLKRKKK